MATMMILAGCSDKPIEAEKKNNNSNEEKQEEKGLDYKRLPLDVDEFMRNYSAMTTISKGEPLPIPDDLEIKEDAKANFITLYSDLSADFDTENWPPTTFNLVLNKEDNSLSAIAYIGRLEVYTFINIVGALDISEEPEVIELVEGYLESPAAYEKEVVLDQMTIAFKSKSGMLTYSFTGK